MEKLYSYHPEIFLCLTATGSISDWEGMGLFSPPLQFQQ